MEPNLQLFVTLGCSAFIAFWVGVFIRDRAHERRIKRNTERLVKNAEAQGWKAAASPKSDGKHR